MTKTNQVKSVEEELRSLHGRFMSGEDLWRELWFRNSASFRKAKSKGRLGLRVFSIPNRRGIFAYTSDVAKWLIDLEGE